MKRYLLLLLIVFILSCDSSQKTITKPYVVLCFDDCNESIYDVAFPVMQTYNFKGTNVACSGFIGTSGYFNWDEISEMESYGWETVSHTSTHTNLIGMSVSEAEEIILEDLNNFHQHGIYPESFALPCGLVSKEIFHMLCDHFNNIRNSMDTINHFPVDPCGIGYYSIQSTYSHEQPLRRIHSAISRQESMVVLGYHRFLEEAGNHPDNCKPEDFCKLLDEIENLGLEVVTLKEAIKYCN